MSDSLDEVIEEALGENPRAEELAQLIAALEMRRESFERERAAAGPERAREWESRVREIDRQIEALQREKAISEFVERSVRATANRPAAPPSWSGEHG